MKIVIYAVCIVIFCANNSVAASSLPKLKKGIGSVGIIINSKSNTVIYYKQGITIFNNSTTTYDIPFGYQDLVRDALSESLSIRNIKVVDIPLREIIGEDKSAGYPMLKKDGEIRSDLLYTFKRVAAQYEVDAVIIVLDSSLGSVVHISGDYHGMRMGTSPILIFSPSGKYAKRINTSINLNGSSLVRQPKTIDAEFLDPAKIKLRIAIEKSINRLFHPYESVDKK